MLCSTLGPSISSLSKNLNLSEMSFGILFTFKGIGYLLGSILCGRIE